MMRLHRRSWRGSVATASCRTLTVCSSPCGVIGLHQTIAVQPMDAEPLSPVRGSLHPDAPCLRLVRRSAVPASRDAMARRSWWCSWAKRRQPSRCARCSGSSASLTTPDDGRMLDLIAQSLDFIGGLRIGDPLPPEVLSGEASWEPDELHLQIANARLQWQLVTWLNSGTGADAPAFDAEFLLQVADDPGTTAAGAAGIRQGGGGARSAGQRDGDPPGGGTGAGTRLYRGVARPAAAPREGDGGEAEPHGAGLSWRRVASRDA